MAAHRSSAKVAQHLPRHWRSVVLGLALGASGLFGLLGPSQFVEHSLEEASAALRRHPASSELRIVEIDAHSIASIDRWPWPRRNYVAVIDRLQRAGAASVSFDVDFSARSNPADDRALGAALARTRMPVILPTFGQESGAGRSGWTDSLPVPELREHATIAAVSVRPDSDGVVRRAPVGTITDGLPRPSLSAAMAGLANGAADSDFPIDYAIDPDTIPRSSFIDVRDGRFDPAAFAGKHVLIGATAIEMGDRYAVPGRGVIPGVVIQALAAETLRGGLPREAGWPLPLLLALALGFGILRIGNGRVLAITVTAAPLLLFGLAVAAKAGFNWSFELAPAMVVLAVVSAATYAARSWVARQVRRSHDTATGLPNRLALCGPGGPGDGAGLVVARFSDYDKLVAALGDRTTADLVGRVQERISLVTEGATIYRVEDRALVWVASDEADLQARLATLRTIMLPPVEVAGRRVDVALNYGFAWRRPDESTDHLLGRGLLAADQALTRGVSWNAHDDLNDEAIDRELSLLGELDDAIGANEIEVVYQPKLALASGRIASAEALVRWNHRTRGRLGPDLFIPLAERNDRIAGLTLYVLERAIADLGRLRAQGLEISVAVNISAKLVDAPDFCAAVRDLVERSGVATNRLIFEVTESAAMVDVEAAAAALDAFREMGISISIDDYGTGQSTLSYLRQLPLDELKLDRKFVQFAHLNRDDAILVQSTVSLAHELGLKVVAEGVEDAGSLAFLRSIGCDMAQGYLISRPVAPDDLLALQLPPIPHAA
ncbi:EAL domain-containing protein [Novosphingobium flavum]|uniref:EAL domain-containing protein n=1 Tax=Novosphingobium aerophilum TaxID=2839843 RepID=UPI00163A57CE|nr:EAL domain-containing protein [Novosphingobium aerophilum]MBC2661318.1 EAL domain-containing protein [Novosphingobium aerophilum]